MFCVSFTCTALNHIQTEKWIALTYNTRTLFISLFCELDKNLWREMVIDQQLLSDCSRNDTVPRNN